MPPRAKITRDMVLDAAFEIAREKGAESINARAVALRLGCSTQPVMYYFATMEELKRVVYARADEYHSAFLMNMERAKEGPLLEIGLNYVRFAREEPHLFQLLFQSGRAGGGGLAQMAEAPELAPVLEALRGTLGLPMAGTRAVFWTIALVAHGCASMIANGFLDYNEEETAAQLKRAFRGAVLAAEEEKTR